ncbi:Hypothetical predicted protein [Marmota monax]|uniref:Uncharacterized protein n=1 Tax=Marmota monax TaxID=9995 RepID=A0A5E4ARG2_MARMO|nr:Hypothetical predicted protein [Marmota monax]
MAASLRLRGATSGLRYWSHRQRPAAASLAAGKDLAPLPQVLAWPPATGDQRAEEVFSPKVAAFCLFCLSPLTWLQMCGVQNLGRGGQGLGVKGGVFGPRTCFFGVWAPRTFGGPSSRGDPAFTPATPAHPDVPGCTVSENTLRPTTVCV